MKNKRGINKNDVFHIMVILGFLAINFVLAKHHELWRDEAQAWLLVRDCTFRHLVEMMQSEGHPFLWHMMLLPFVRAGFSPDIMKYISLLVVTAGVAVMVRYAPFHPLIKLLVCGLCTYYLPDVARSYCVVVFVLFSVAVLYSGRHEHCMLYGILLYLLTQIHLIMEGAAIALITLYLLEVLQDRGYRKNKKQYLPVIMGMLGILQLIWILWGADTHSASDRIWSHVFAIPKVLWDAYGAVLAEIFYEKLAFMILPVQILTVLLLVLLLISWKQYGKELWIMLCMLGAQTVIAGYITNSNKQRSLCVITGFVFLLWLIRDKAGCEKRRMRERFVPVCNVVLVILCIGCLLPTIYQNAKRDIYDPYSDAGHIAEVLKEKGYEDALILTPHEYLTGALLCYLPEAAGYSVANEKYYTYIDWRDDTSDQITQEQFVKVAEEQKKRYRHVIFLTCIYIYPQGFDTNSVSILYKSYGNEMTEEAFYVCEM